MNRTLPLRYNLETVPSILRKSGFHTSSLLSDQAYYVTTIRPAALLNHAVVGSGVEAF